MKNAMHNQAAFILIFKRWIACVRVKRNKKRCKTSPPNRIIRHLFDQIIIGDGRPQGITKKNPKGNNIMKTEEMKNTSFNDCCIHSKNNKMQQRTKYLDSFERTMRSMNNTFYLCATHHNRRK